MRKLVILLVFAVLAWAPATASASRAIALHGAAKVVLITDSNIDNLSKTPVGSPGNDQGTLPNRWAVYHCYSAWVLSGADWRWGVWTWTGWSKRDKRRCERFGFNGVTIVYKNRAGYWEDDSGGDQLSQHTCAEITTFLQPGRPRPTARIVRALLRPLGGCR